MYVDVGQDVNAKSLEHGRRTIAAAQMGMISFLKG